MRVDQEIKKVEVKVSSKKKKVVGIPVIHIIHILDGSGSMGPYFSTPSKFDSAIEGMEEEIESIKQETDKVEYTYTVVEFDSSYNIQTLALKAKVKDLSISDINLFKPNGNTALYDAIGKTLSSFECKDTDKVIVKIFTDGGENGSTKYNAKMIKDLISEKEKEDWVITFVGTEHDVNYVISNLSVSIGNTMTHDNTPSGMRSAYAASNMARQVFAKSVVDGNENNTTYFSSIK